MNESVFSPRAIALLLACAISLFALSVLLPAYDDGSPSAWNSTARPDSYSISALGHAGFYDTLRRLDFPVRRGTEAPLALAGDKGTIIVAEPDPIHISDDTLKFLRAPRLLLVLPKRWGFRDPDRPSWNSETGTASITDARGTLHLVIANGAVSRGPWPEAWTQNAFPFSPSGSGEIQLVNSSIMHPLVGTKDGMLLGELNLKDRAVWILSDPDVLANHGLLKGDNAAFMTAVVDALRRRGNDDMNAPIVFDETVHGHQKPNGSVLTLLFRFPFVVVTALLAATAVLLALAGSSRFGPPRRLPPELDFGKAGLIANSARLLDYAGHHAVTLRRYLRMTVRQAARTLHAPSGLDEPALIAWLDRVGKARLTTHSCAEILQRADAAGTASDPRNLVRLFACSLDIHRWKEELLHGSATHRRNR